MLVLRRKDGQWIDVTHVATGETFRFRVYDIANGVANLAFDDPARKFVFQRPERHLGPARI